MNKSTYREHIKSISSLTGQIATSVVVPVYEEDNKQNIRLTAETESFPSEIEYIIHEVSMSSLPRIEKFLLTMLAMNGLRISEITNPVSYIPINDESFAIYAPKQKKYKICYYYGYKPSFTSDFEVELVRGWNRSRQYYYRILNSLVPEIKSQRKHNKPVTHACRNLIAQSAFSKNSKIEDVMNAIGVVRESSAARYLTELQLEEYVSLINRDV